MKYRSSIIALLLGLAILGNPALLPAETFFREDFNDLTRWTPFHFPKIKVHSVYSIAQIDGESALETKSQASASALIMKETFDASAFPKLRWRWKVANLYSKANPDTKTGDDYPIRVYVMFKYDPTKAKGLNKIKYGLAKSLYGQYPPHSSLNYVWASGPTQKAIFPNPYTDRAMMVVLEQGKLKMGTWVEESVDILTDYRRAFGEDPPAQATLAVMNDSDNTGESAVSFIDAIEIFR